MEFGLKFAEYPCLAASDPELGDDECDDEAAFDPAAADLLLGVQSCLLPAPLLLDFLTVGVLVVGTAPLPGEPDGVPDFTEDCFTERGIGPVAADVWALEPAPEVCVPEAGAPLPVPDLILDPVPDFSLDPGTLLLTPSSALDSDFPSGA